MADNKTIQKIFSLSDYRKKQLVGEIVERTRETYREYGYFGGGSPGPLSTVDRIDYSNDTAQASPRGPLSLARGDLSATGNSNFGYFICGQSVTNAVHSQIQRINYANDSSNLSFRSNDISANRRLSSVSNLNYVYIYSGIQGSPSAPITSVIRRIDYSNDLLSPVIRAKNSLSVDRGTTSTTNFGYFGGGYAISSLSRISYFNDTQLELFRSNFPLTTYNGFSGTGNSNFGYFAGFVSFPDFINRSIVYRIDYSNDIATASPRGPLSLARSSLSATGNSNFGYFGGGGPGPLSTVDRIDYSNDTAQASPRGPLSLGKSNLAATSSHSFGGSPNSSFASNFTFPTVPNAGYFGGGFDGTNNLATIDKVDYANDTTTASVRSALSLARYGLAATSNGNFGYFGGGFSPLYSTVDRIEYSSDTQNAVIRGPLSSTKYRLAASGNSNFGYYAGGATPSSISTVDRIDYSSDTSAVSVRGPLSITKRFFTATGNSNFGYYAGGGTPSVVSSVDRINYSNDTATSLVRGSLSSLRSRNSATGNSNFGYFGGSGNPIFSTIDRIDYSNDTQTASIRGPLSQSIGTLSATGSQNFGYFGGGSISPSVYYSTVDRINFSNDTAVASIRGPLSTAKLALAATSPLGYGGAPIYFTNPLPEVLQKQIEFDDSNTLDLPFKRVLGSFGYFGGGSTPSLYSNISRLDFSNDTSNSSARGPLSSTRYSHQATGNSNFGYFGGGRIILSPSPIVTSVDRIDYSSDTSTGISRGALSATSYFTNAITSGSFGYFDSFGNISKLNYSNDSQTSVTKFTRVRSQNRYGLSGNSNFAYYAGGGSTSLIDRLNFSNDSGNTVYRGNLIYNKNDCCSVGNNNFGYVGGARGTSPVEITAVDRIDYSNDTATTSLRFNLDRFRNTSTGNQSFGYFAMGASTTGAGVFSTIHRLDYSNDTSVSIRPNTTYSSWFARGITNARNS